MVQEFVYLNHLNLLYPKKKMGAAILVTKRTPNCLLLSGSSTSLLVWNDRLATQYSFSLSTTLSWYCHLMELYLLGCISLFHLWTDEPICSSTKTYSMFIFCWQCNWTSLCWCTGLLQMSWMFFFFFKFSSETSHFVEYKLKYI